MGPKTLGIKQNLWVKVWIPRPGTFKRFKRRFLASESAWKESQPQGLGKVLHSHHRHPGLLLTSVQLKITFLHNLITSVFIVFIIVEKVTLLKSLSLQAVTTLQSRRTPPEATYNECRNGSSVLAV